MSTHDDIWPVPHRSWPRRTALRVAKWLGYLGFFAALITVQSTGPGTEAPRAPLATRVRRLREGGSDSIRARVIGRSAWCPTFPDENVIRLEWRSAVSTLGRDRTIPVEHLAPVAVHTPRTKPGQEKLPRRYWVLDLDGPVAREASPPRSRTSRCSGPPRAGEHRPASRSWSPVGEADDAQPVCSSATQRA